MNTRLVRAQTLIQAGSYQDAAMTLEKYLRHAPDDPRAHQLSGVCRLRLLETSSAISHFRRAAELEPVVPEHWSNLGVAYRAAGLHEDAIQSFRRALERRPSYAEAHFNCGNAMLSLGRLAEAISCFQSALVYRADFPSAKVNLSVALARQGCSDDAAALIRNLLKHPDLDAELHSSMLLSLLHVSDDRMELLQAHRGWGRRYEQKDAAPLTDASGDRPLVVGFVSPDFRDNVVGYMIEPLLHELNRSEFSIVCYSHAPRSDEITEEIKRSSDQWRDIAGWPDAQVVEQIRQDRVDLLIDLATHVAHNRLPIFAAKPAPVQATMMNYPFSSGLATMDWRITDVHMEPESVGDMADTEKVYRMPRTWQCHTVRECGVEVAVEPPSVSSGFITLGALNRPNKITPTVVRIWARILQSLDGARLKLLVRSEVDSPEPIRDQFKNEGIATDRLDFEPTRPRADYLRLFQHIDLCLDTYPYSGCNTTFDSIFMGVPVITYAGPLPPGRHSTSILRNAGLDECIADSLDEYVAKAIELASSPERLVGYRQSLRNRVLQSPLVDRRQYARDVEEAFRAIWQDYVGPLKMP